MATRSVPDGCPGCSRSRVALIGGLCGYCSNRVTHSVGEALENETPINIDEIEFVSLLEDGRLRIDVLTEDDRDVE